MSPKPLAFKVAALSFSVLLAGSYVWYRSGGSLPFVSSPVAAETPEEPPSNPRDIDVIEVPPEILAKIEEQEADAKAIDGIDRTILLSGSKSEGVFVPRDEPDRSIFMAGPKSDRPIFEEPPPARHREPDDPMYTGKTRFPAVSGARKKTSIGADKPAIPDPAIHRELLMDGAKSGGFRPSAPPAPKAEPNPNPRKKYKIVALPGSKAGAIQIEVDDNDEPVKPVPSQQPQAATQSAAPATPPKRTILPGSKSAAVVVERVPEPKPQATQAAPAQQQERQQRQQAAPAVPPKRTILPGSKSMRIEIEPKAPVAPATGGAQ